ncbi:MAG: glycosyltransferase [Chloroflexi bacterium]|nr:MAG: glycosyltransferase [Chloroflexota bacterium]
MSENSILRSSGDQPDPNSLDTLQMTIPTTDAQEALEFCRSLAKMLTKVEANNAARPEQELPVLSIVVPVFNEEDNIPVLYERLTHVLTAAEPCYELVFVDDGSRDHSLALLNELAKKDIRITVVELARNFGHQIAISAGLDYTRGKAVIIMDADLQDPPEVLPQFIEKWREGHDVVYAIRVRRKEGFAKMIAYAAFYRILQRIANIQIPLDAGDFCIMDRRVVDILVNMPERNRFVRGIRSWIGLDQVGLAYERQSRYSGKPKYTFSRLLYLALDGLISFSYIPLRTITFLGFSISIISILVAVYYTMKKLTVGLAPQGFAATIVSILFLAGMQLITIGVIGEYVGRIFEEVKRRPLYLVRQVIRSRSL